MTLFFTYYSPTTPYAAGWSEPLGNQVVRLARMGPVVCEAQLGAVAISSLVLDDPAASVGHSGDAVAGLKQVAITETAAPVNRRRIWTGYTGDRRYRRGEPGDRGSLIQGSARVVDATLVDINSFLSFRIFSESGANRPAETDVARVQWLLGASLLDSTLYDQGLVSTAGPVDMDAADYRGQRPADLLNDCSQQSGKNHFVYYDEATGRFSLFYDFNHSTAYRSALRLSNVPADVDGSTTFAPHPDAVLQRDPSRVASGVWMPYAAGSVYRTQTDAGLDTAARFGWRDHAAPSVNVKTSAQATARADRYLGENATEDETLTVRATLPRANVNDWREGEAAQVKLVHLPGLDAFRWVRALRRSVEQTSETDEHYDVEWECTVLPGEPQEAWARYASGLPTYARPTFLEATTPGARLVAVVISQGGIGQTAISHPGFWDVGAVGSTAQTWTRHAWVASKSATQFPGGSTRGVAIGVFSRLVGANELTTTPVEVTPGNPAVPSGALQVFLWELPLGASLGSVQTLGASYTGDIPTPLSPETSFGSTVTPGGTVAVGSAMTGALVLGGIVVGAEPYGNGPVVVAVEGTQIENKDATRTALADVNSHSPPVTYLAKLASGGTIRASVSNSPGPTYPTSYNHFQVAGVAIQISGLTDIEAPA